MAKTKVTKGDLKEAKAALTSYLKENKLKRDGEYTGKHAKAIAKMEAEITRIESLLSDKETKTKENTKKKAKSSGGTTRGKYDYPPECDTPEKRKKFRMEQRKLAKSGGEASKAKKVTVKVKAKAEEKPTKVKKVKATKTKEASSKTKKGKSSKKPSKHKDD